MRVQIILPFLVKKYPNNHLKNHPFLVWVGHFLVNLQFKPSITISIWYEGSIFAWNCLIHLIFQIYCHKLCLLYYLFIPSVSVISLPLHFKQCFFIPLLFLYCSVLPKFVNFVSFIPPAPKKQLLNLLFFLSLSIPSTFFGFIELLL